MRARHALAATALALLAPLAAASDVKDFATAKALSASSGKPVLIDFSAPT
jgi:hypothetical protein